MSAPFLIINSFEFWSISKQVTGFIVGLSEVNQARIAAGAEMLVASFEENRYSGRAERIRDAEIGGLFEFKATLPGGGVQLRFICLRERQRILCARGFEKRAARIPRSEVKAAERAIRAYWKARNEPSTRKGRR